ncbi:MAG: DNA replication/repair protein RecF [Anaerolineales bacterium]
MYIKHLSLTNFRNFTRLDIDVPRRVVVLVGSNAQGKTSLLEAIYFTSALTSFQTHADRQLVNFLAVREAQKQVSVGRIVADFHRGGSDHRLEARLIMEPTGVVNGVRLRKEVLLDGVKKPLNELVGQFNAVIFVPQMSQILEGGPDERRRYLNLGLAQTVPAYVRTFSEYNQALSQRNALLKALNERGGSDNGQQLEVWDEALARLGAQIILWRIQAVHEIERLAARVHSELTRGKEVLRLNYQPAFDPLPQPEMQIGLKIDTPLDRSGLTLDEIHAGFLERLKRLRREEIARGMTTIGPHRDDLRFLANGIDLGHYGSRGQIRTTLLALKLAEVSWMHGRTGEWPVILLDEVMAELDLERRADLLKYLGESEQVLFTTTDLGLFTEEFANAAEVWQVQAGNVRQGSEM